MAAPISARELRKSYLIKVHIMGLVVNDVPKSILRDSSRGAGAREIFSRLYAPLKIQKASAMRAASPAWDSGRAGERESRRAILAGERGGSIPIANIF